jgi:hypothetical protein
MQLRGLAKNFCCESVPGLSVKNHQVFFIPAENKQIKSEPYGQGKRKILLPICEVSTNSM